jgi:hypothetical protein
VLLCPSDPSPVNGLTSIGWAGTSYAPVSEVFGAIKVYRPAVERFVTHGKYKLDNIPDGTSQVIGMVERYASFPYYEWTNTALFPMDMEYWGANSYGSAYGYWGLWTPQIRPPLHGWSGTRSPAHPWYPNTGHDVMNSLLMDASVRRISVSVDPARWASFCIPDDSFMIPQWD